MYEDVDVFMGAKMLERCIHQLNSFAYPLGLSVDALLSKFGEKRVLLDGVDFPGAQACHFNGKKGKAGTTFDTNSALNETAVFAE